MNSYRLVALFLLLGFSQTFAYTSHINALAVLIGTDKGIATGVNLTITAGNGTITVGSPNSTIAQTTTQSADIAVAYATSYLNVNESKYNYNFTFISPQARNISGPSAGLALMLLTISGIRQVPIPSNITATGIISSNGSVTAVGGVTDKIAAAKQIGSEFVVVPSAPNTSFDYSLYYMAQQADAIPVIMVSNASQAIAYVFGGKAVEPLTFNITTSYNIAGLNYSSAICQSCADNDSQFQIITNATLDLLEQQINDINGTLFSSVKTQLQSQLLQYKQIQAKGYQYTASDLAFLDYPTAFLFSNYKASTIPQAQLVIANVSAYCGALNYTPLTTDANYQYVISGQARYAWAMTSLDEAAAFVNTSQSSDDLYAALLTAARSYAWCAAVSQIYNISSQVGGNATMESPALANQAARAISAAKAKYGDLLYVNESQYSYNLGEYGAALYTIAYANTFYNASNSPLYNSTSQANLSAIYGTITSAVNSANGVWQREFALQSYFYYNQAALSPSTNDTRGYLMAAFTTAKLSQNLDAASLAVGAGLIPATNSTQISPAQFQQLMSQIQLIEAVMIIILIAVFALFALFLYHILDQKKEGNEKRRR